MPGRHRKPGTASRRIARTGAFAVIAGAPMLITGTAVAAPAAGHAPEKRVEHRADNEDADYGELFGEDEDTSDEDSGSRDDDEADDDNDAADDATDAEPGDAEESVTGATRRYTPHTRRDTTSDDDSSSGGTSSGSDRHWDQLADCESKQDWNADTGNGYKGGLQFDDATWRQYGGRQYAPSADQASREEQIAVAKKVQRKQGWNAWPSCSRQLGYA
jgi:hypothetical protein